MLKTLSLALSLLFVSTVTAQAGCQDPQTQTEMNICAHEEYKVIDGKLNIVYAKTINRLSAKHKTALKKAQRAWITYRDLACDSYGLIAEGGTMQSMLVSNCLTTVTRERTKLLVEQTLGN